MSKDKPKKNPRDRRRSGACPAAHQVPHRWKIDYDYVRTLSLEDEHWLAEFSDCYYAGDFKSDAETRAWSPQERRRAFTARNAGWADAYARAGPAGALWPISDDGRELADRIDLEEPARRQDMSYLDTPEYREALANYRRTLAQGRRDMSPKHPQHDKALEHLRRTIRALQLKASEHAPSED